MNALHDDVTLLFEGYKIECSKSELARHSDYFRAMFEGNFSERDKDIVTMNGVDFRSLRICLIMVWNRKFILTDEDLPSVLQTACMLQFEEIIEIIGDKLLENLDVSNCLKVWFLTEPLNLKPLYLKAKNMALVEFKAIQANGILFNLTMEELHKYLANAYLICKEFDVFLAFMSWHYVNGNNLMELLACLDFNRLSNNEIGEMMMYPDVKSSLALVNVLECVIAIRKGQSVRNDLAQKVINCNHRICKIDPFFFIAVESEEKVIEDHKDTYKKKRRRKMLTKNTLLQYDADAEEEEQNFWKTIDLCKEKFEGYFGYELIGYKQQIFLFGGETSMGKGQWNCNFWIYDSVRERWNLMANMPSGRRHFETCIIDNIVYIIGGTGKFRVIQNNMLAFDYVANTWSKEIALPESGLNVKCCNYMNRLFLFYQQLKCGYLYDPDSGNFVQLNIVDENFPKIEGKFAVYCFNDRIFVQDSSRLVELQVLLEKLRVVNVSTLLDSVYEVGDKFVLCHDTVYSIQKMGNINITKFNLLTQKTETIHLRDRSRCELNTDCKLLMLHHYLRLSDKDKYVNTIENLFAK